MERLTILSYGAIEGIEERKAFEAMASEWRLWGFRLALKITGCPESSEDALQDALLRAFRSASKLRDPQAAGAWFRRIVVRCAMEQSVLPPTSELDNQQERDRQFGLEEVLQVRSTLGRMKPEQRALLALSVGEGLSYEEIGETLGIKTGTVASRIHAAKQAFRERWEEAE